MPGNPIAKSNKIDALCERFADLATEFDELLPECYRYNGEQPGKDQRANAWALVDQRMILTAEALTHYERSCAVMRSCRLTTLAPQVQLKHRDNDDRDNPRPP